MHMVKNYNHIRFFFLLLGIETRGILPLRYTPCPILFFILKQGLTKLLKLTANLRSSCLSLPSTRITVMCHHAQLEFFLTYLYWVPTLCVQHVNSFNAMVWLIIVPIWGWVHRDWADCMNCVQPTRWRTQIRKDPVNMSGKELTDYSIGKSSSTHMYILTINSSLWGFVFI